MRWWWGLGPLSHRVVELFVQLRAETVEAVPIIPAHGPRSANFFRVCGTQMHMERCGGVRGGATPSNVLLSWAVRRLYFAGLSRSRRGVAQRAVGVSARGLEVEMRGGSGACIEGG
jgi:hypothetical protein